MTYFYYYNILFQHITPYAAYLYDAVTLYADALSKALKNNTDPRNGREIMRIFRERKEYTSNKIIISAYFSLEVNLFKYRSLSKSNFYSYPYQYCKVFTTQILLNILGCLL